MRTVDGRTGVPRSGGGVAVVAAIKARKTYIVSYLLSTKEGKIQREVGAALGSLYFLNYQRWHRCRWLNGFRPSVHKKDALLFSPRLAGSRGKHEWRPPSCSGPECVARRAPAALAAAAATAAAARPAYRPPKRPISTAVTSIYRTKRTRPGRTPSRPAPPHQRPRSRVAHCLCRWPSLNPAARNSSPGTPG